MGKPDFQEVIEDLPVVTFATQLRRLDARVASAEGDHVVVGVSDLKALLDHIKERDHRVNWFTTCKNCAGLWDKVYEYDMERQRLRSALEYVRDEAKATIAWRNNKGMRPATDTSIFAATALSGCIAIVREMERVLGAT